MHHPNNGVEPCFKSEQQYKKQECTLFMKVELSMIKLCGRQRWNSKSCVAEHLRFEQGLEEQDCPVLCGNRSRFRK